MEGLHIKFFYTLSSVLKQKKIRVKLILLHYTMQTKRRGTFQFNI